MTRRRLFQLLAGLPLVGQIPAVRRRLVIEDVAPEGAYRFAPGMEIEIFQCRADGMYANNGEGWRKISKEVRHS